MIQDMQGYCSLMLSLLTVLRFFSKAGSEIFRSVLIHGKEKEHRKQIFHNRAKKITFLTEFDRSNPVFF